MKNKSVLAFALAALLLLLPMGCTVEDATGTTTTAATTTGSTTTTAATESLTTTVTTTIARQTTTSDVTTTTSYQGAIGGDNWHYISRYVTEFYIERRVSKLVDKTAYDQWCNTFENYDAGGTRSKYEYNVYELIQEFEITRTQIEEVCQDYESRHPGYIYFTDEQVDILFTGTREEVYRYFAYPTAIFIAPGDQVYPPKWLAEHTAAEYLEVGITYDILNAKIDDVLDPTFPEDVKQHILAQKNILQNLCASTSSESVTTTTTLSQGE